jgi:hypothetical protein
MKLLFLATTTAALFSTAAPVFSDTVFDRMAPGESKRVEISLRARIGPLELARGTFNATITPESYQADATYRTSGIGAALSNDAGQTRSRGNVARGSLRPTSFNNQESTGKRRRIEMSWGGGSVRAVSNPPWGTNMGQPPATEAQKLEAVDPLTGLMQLSLLTGRGEGKACGGVVKIFDGKRRYDIRTQYVGPTTVSTPAYQGPAIRCTGQYVEVAGFKAKKPGEKAEPIKLVLILADIGGMGVSVPVRMQASVKGITGTLYAERVTIR